MPLPERGLVMYEAGRSAGGGGSSRPPVIVEALPEIGQYGVTYLVPNGGAPPNIYDEYVWVSPEAGYELLGQKEVDLSRYVRDTRTVNGHPLSANVVVTYADLPDKPTDVTAAQIEQAVSDAWDAVFEEE